MTTSGAPRARVLERLMGVVDQYLIMSYSTSPTTVVAELKAELEYAGTLPLAQRFLVSASLETTTGVGSGEERLASFPPPHPDVAAL